MNWLQIIIHIRRTHLEYTEQILLDAGALTVTYTDAADQPILEPGVDQTPVWDELVLTGLFDNKGQKAALLEQLQQQLGEVAGELHAEVLQDQDWTRAWMDHYDAMQFGERLWVVPLHMQPPDSNAVNLRLDPGLAFGTGTHPTTSLCLKWLDRHCDQQESLLDYGCGSGILAIAACMLGVKQAHGVDIDPQALVATKDNAETNNVSEHIECWLPDDYNRLHANTRYDIVAANILSGPLAELAPTLAAHCKTGGHIVLSGILREQADAVLDAYKDGFEMDPPVFEEDWTLLHGIKRG